MLHNWRCHCRTMSGTSRDLGNRFPTAQVRGRVKYLVPRSQPTLAMMLKSQRLTHSQLILDKFRAYFCLSRGVIYNKRHFYRSSPTFLSLERVVNMEASTVSPSIGSPDSCGRQRPKATARHLATLKNLAPPHSQSIVPHSAMHLADIGCARNVKHFCLPPTTNPMSHSMAA